MCNVDVPVMLILNSLEQAYLSDRGIYYILISIQIRVSDSQKILDWKCVTQISSGYVGR